MFEETCVLANLFYSILGLFEKTYGLLASAVDDVVAGLNGVVRVSASVTRHVDSLFEGLFCLQEIVSVSWMWK